MQASSCSKDNTQPKAPTDETKDRGHDMPDKVQFIITDIGTNEVQERTANKSPKDIVYDINTPTTMANRTRNTASKSYITTIMRV